MADVNAIQVGETMGEALERDHPWLAVAGQHEDADAAPKLREADYESLGIGIRMTRRIEWYVNP